MASVSAAITPNFDPPGSAQVAYHRIPANAISDSLPRAAHSSVLAMDLPTSLHAVCRPRHGTSAT